MSRKRLGCVLCFLAWSLGVLYSETELRFSNVLTDNMVLQRDKDLSCWGWAKPGSEVEVMLTQSRDEVIAFVGEKALDRVTGRQPKIVEHEKIGKVRLSYIDESSRVLKTINRTIKAGQNGKWIVKLGSHGASYSPTFLAAKSEGTGIAIKNLLIGEVWIASGQSNMRWKGRANMWESEGLLPNAVRYASHQAGSSTPEDTIGYPVQWMKAEDGVAKTFSTIPYFFGKFLHERLKVPVGIINIAQGGSFSSEWCSREVLESANSPLISKSLKDYDQKAIDDPNFKGIRGPATLFNARLFPIRHLSVSGVIYLQGENEALSGTLVEYQKTFPGVIESYREALDRPDLPFGIISLQGMGAQKGYSISSYSIARSIHLQTHLKTPNTGYIVAHDIGGGIHPNYKRPLSERAVYWALRDVYGVLGSVKKTRVKDVIFEKEKAIISFEEVTLKNGEWTEPKTVTPRANNQAPISGFMIAGENQVWFPGVVGGSGELDGLTTLSISSPMVPKPAALRYGWEGWSRANLGPFYDPIPPYRSDDWPLLPKDELMSPDLDAMPLGEKRYLESHETKARMLELPLNEGVAISAKNLALRHASPKKMMLSMLTGVEGLLDHFQSEKYEEMTQEWAEKAFHTIPPRYWRRDRMNPTRLAKWSWLMERALRFDTFASDMEKSLGEKEVMAKLQNLKDAIEEFKGELEALPEENVMTRPEMLDKFLPLAEKEKERLLKKGVDLRTLEREMGRRPF
jgi:sialate O-acetylesterase